MVFFWFLRLSAPVLAGREAGLPQQLQLQGLFNGAKQKIPKALLDCLINAQS